MEYAKYTTQIRRTDLHNNDPDVEEYIKTWEIYTSSVCMRKSRESFLFSLSRPSYRANLPLY
jgi:hypothetical protein